MAALYPGQVNESLARTLQPQSGFDPSGYYGDPARFATDGIRRAANVAAANIADQVANAERHS